MTEQPPRPRAPRPSTALLDAFERADGAVLMALLDDCRARGAMPMATGRQTLFAAMAEAPIDLPLTSFTCTVLRELRRAGIPQRWRTAIGYALLRASAPAASSTSGRPAPQFALNLRLPMLMPIAPKNNRGFALLMHASMRPDQWLKLLTRGSDARNLPTALACAQFEHAERGQILRNMVDDGLDIDAPRAAIDDAECTMLQAAAKNDCAEMVAVLLELGADPFAKFMPDWPPQDAFALAPEGGTARQVLSAWRAQRALTAVLRPGAGQPRRAHP